MEEALRAVLVGDTALAALVDTRIVWNKIPQGSENPCVWLYRITGAPGYTMEGADGLYASLVQINVRATSVASMWAVARAIEAALSGYAGTEGDIEFQGIFLRSERQGSEKPADTLFHTCQMDFDVLSRTADAS